MSAVIEEGGEVVFFFFPLLSSLHVSVRNVYRKQTCFLAFTRESHIVVCFSWLIDEEGGFKRKDRKHRCQVPKFHQVARTHFKAGVLKVEDVCLGLNSSNMSFSDKITC